MAMPGDVDRAAKAEAAAAYGASSRSRRRCGAVAGIVQRPAIPEARRSACATRAPRSPSARTTFGRARAGARDRGARAGRSGDRGAAQRAAASNDALRARCAARDLDAQRAPSRRSRGPRARASPPGTRACARRGRRAKWRACAQRAAGEARRARCRLGRRGLHRRRGEHAAGDAPARRRRSFSIVYSATSTVPSCRPAAAAGSGGRR